MSDPMEAHKRYADKMIKELAERLEDKPILGLCLSCHKGDCCDPSRDVDVIDVGTCCECTCGCDARRWA